MTVLPLVAAVALAGLAYTYVGYPVAIGVLARLRGRRTQAAPDVPDVPKISVILPLHDAARFLPAKVESLLALDYPPDKLEILVYCDGCRDDSEEVARRLAASPAAAGRIRVIADADQRGKPTGINVLAAAATGELLLLNDVRQPLTPNTARALAEALADPSVGCATGQLVLAGGAASGVYWRYEDWIRRQESRFRGVVGMTGAIAMMRRSDFEPLPADVLLDDVLMPMRLVLRRKRVVSVPAAQAFDEAFEDDREFRRKARTLAGNYQLFAMLPAVLIPFANPIWFETFSHKVMRLIAPWLMLALLVVSVLGARGATVGGPWAALLVAQLGFYVAAIAGKRLGRLGGLARTFVVMNLAALVGLWRWATGRLAW
jgi:biofilm PGA synthesis N-glycosyltransferase PgaC